MKKLGKFNEEATKIKKGSTLHQMAMRPTERSSHFSKAFEGGGTNRSGWDPEKKSDKKSFH